MMPAQPVPKPADQLVRLPRTRARSSDASACCPSPMPCQTAAALSRIRSEPRSHPEETRATIRSRGGRVVDVTGSGSPHFPGAGIAGGGGAAGIDANKNPVATLVRRRAEGVAAGTAGGGAAAAPGTARVRPYRYAGHGAAPCAQLGGGAARRPQRPLQEDVHAGAGAFTGTEAGPGTGGELPVGRLPASHRARGRRGGPPGTRWHGDRRGRRTATVRSGHGREPFTA